jgi:formylglycine-generating enzyme
VNQGIIQLRITDFAFVVKIKLHFLFIALVLLAGPYAARAQTANVVNLSVAPAGNQTLLFWPASAANYSLQSTTNLGSLNWETVRNADTVLVTNVVNGEPGIVNLTVIVTNTLPARFFRLHEITNPPAIPVGMALIPAGAFTMGDNLEGASDAIPTVIVTVLAFYVDVNLVSYSQWQTVYNWATSQEYGFANVGAGKASNHPVQTVNWYDTVKWCNARSQQAGLSPAYYTDAGLTQICSNGETTVYVNWAANGYRLPTEAEWEKAARGGLSGQRFPWGNTISESQANYYGFTNGYTYDLGPNGPNATFAQGLTPYTSPVGSFAPNGYGLYDMAGNVEEWCWDWYGTPYGGGNDPHGPVSGGSRVVRGGVWEYGAYSARCAVRSKYSPSLGHMDLGFRCVRGL